MLNLYNATLGSLSQGSTPVANRIGKQLGPITPTWAPARPTFDALDVVGDRLCALRLAQEGQAGDQPRGTSCNEPAQGTGLWGSAFGGYEHQSGQDEVDGYSATYGELLLGADFSPNEHWRVGGAVGISNTSIDSSGDTSGNNTRVNGYGLIGYASFAGTPWYVNFSAAAVQQDYHIHRAIDFQGYSDSAPGHFSGQLFVARTEAGYPLPLGNATLTPLASLMYSYQTQAGYTESSSGGAALAVNAAHANSLKSGLGARLEQGFSTRYGQVVLDGRAQWIHEYNPTGQTMVARFAGDPTGQTAFTTVGISPVADLADFLVGVTLLRASNLSLSARYEVQAGKGFVSQMGSLRLRQLF
ncbi:autotransporter outer membrane beta-barrel domain-containing protein [Paraburkholderia aspalathi]|uniref:autotransporter outer membrane beta-barrel domain-containing protein n=1 Tax=Paraburkholderia aspalathi TaxID=1324617 RepID=UPI0027DB6985|nr:autotransporter domain-containing protein [Paraburkholderia aspalathi]